MLSANIFGKQSYEGGSNHYIFGGCQNGAHSFLLFFFLFGPREKEGKGEVNKKG
jgi:hypothetical protein